MGKKEDDNDQYSDPPYAWNFCRKLPEQTYYAQYTDISAGAFALTGPDAEPTDIALIKDVSGENIKGISLEWVLEDADCPSTVADVTHASFTALVICPEEGKEAPEDDPYYLKDDDPCNPTVTIIDQAGCPQTARSDEEIAMSFGFRRYPDRYTSRLLLLRLVVLLQKQR